MLVGRTAVMAACEALLAAAVDGQGRLLVLAGEAGIGKSALARAVGERAEASGVSVRRGSCWESDGLPPFTPWIDALRLPDGGPCATAARRLEGRDQPSPADAAGARRARVRRISDVADALRDAAATRTQVIVLEDLHWADESSIELLVALAPRLSTMGVLVVLTVRDDELPAGSALRSLGGDAEWIQLTGLSLDDTALLLEDALGRPPSPAETDRVHRQTAGNPLLVTQVGRLLGAGSTTVPAAARDILARRLARVSTACDHVLAGAAVLGPAFDEDVLATMLAVPVAEALDEAVAARLVVADEECPRRWRFVHALVQAACYERVPGRRRGELHSRAADALTGTGQTPPASAAHHALRGHFAAGDPRPAEILLAAGGGALDRMSWTDAIALFERAGELAPEGAAGDTLRAESWLGVGAARLRLDRTDARDAFDRAAEVGRRTAQPEIVGRAALGFSVGLGAFEVRLFDHHQIELLEEAASSLPTTHRLLPLVLARLSVALSYIGSADRRAELARRSVHLARSAGDSVVLGHALCAWSDAVSGPAHVADRLDASGEAVTLAQRAGDLELELLGRRLRFIALVEQCDLAGADVEVQGYSETAERLGDALYSWFVPLWRAMRAHARGELAAAADVLADARQLGTAGGSFNSDLLCHVHASMVAIEHRDHVAANEHFEAIRELLPAIPRCYYALFEALLADAGGDGSRLRRVLKRLRPAAFDELPHDSEWLPTIIQLAVVAARGGDSELIAYARDALGPFAELAGVEGIGAYLHGPVRRFLVLLAGAAGDRTAVRADLDEALAAAVPCGALIEAHTARDGAWALLQAGDPGDAAWARELAQRAAATYRTFGLDALLSDAEAMVVAADGERADASPADHRRDQLPSLRRQGDSWAWTWDGTTVHVRHAKGVSDLALLLERPGREVHVRELEGVADRRSASVADRALDPAAVTSYRRRLADLEEDLDEADRHADVARAERLAAERDALLDELTRAFGIGGRSRRAGSDPDERLRKAVSARVKASIDRIATLHPGLGRHLRNAVRTGFWCRYQPERPVTWDVRRG